MANGFFGLLGHALVKRRVDEDLQEKLRLLKERAQVEEEDVVTRFVFDDGNLFMRAKGSEGFNWILHNQSITLAVNRGSKMGLPGQVRLSSQYLWSMGIWIKRFRMFTCS